MKIATLSESSADEAALRVLVGGILRRGSGVSFLGPGFRARGWPSVVQVLPAVIRHLHFNTDADSLVVSVDSDDSVVHTPAHDAPEYYHPQCRLCQLRSVFRRVSRKLPPARGRERVLRGAGVAVPAIEAWFLCGLDDSVTESTWADALAAGRLPPYTRPMLKYRVYGTDRPSLPLETRRAIDEARRHARDTRRLENDFPGFAALAADVRGWQAVRSSL